MKIHVWWKYMFLLSNFRSPFWVGFFTKRKFTNLEQLTNCSVLSTREVSILERHLSRRVILYNGNSLSPYVQWLPPHSVCNPYEFLIFVLTLSSWLDVHKRSLSEGIKTKASRSDNKTIIKFHFLKFWQTNSIMWKYR